MSITKRALLAIPLLVLAALMILVPLGVVRAATTYTTTVEVVGPTNAALSSASVSVYFLNGTKVASGTTNSTGYVQFSLANGTYLFVVSTGKYYIFSLGKVAGTTKITINATKLHYANFTSVPVTTSFTLEKIDNSNVSLSLNTNTTVYGDHNATAAFPASFISFPYEYKLSQVKNATTTVSTGTIFVNFTSANQVVTATYTGTLAYTSPEFLLIVGLILVIIIGGAAYAATHAIFNEAFRYVRSAGVRTKRYVRSVGSEAEHFVRRADNEDVRHYVHRDDDEE